MEDLDGSAIEAMIAEGRRIVEDAIAEHKPCAIIAAFSGGNDSVVATHFAVANFGAGVLHCNTGTGLAKTADHVHRTADRLKWDLVEVFADDCRNGKPDDLDEAVELPFGRWVDGDNAYEDFVLNFGFPGRGQHNRMFNRLKERPLAAHCRSLLANHWGRLAGWKGIDATTVRSIVFDDVPLAATLPREERDRLRDVRRWMNRMRRENGNPVVMIISGIRHDESAIRAGYKRSVQRETKNPRVWVNPFYWRAAADFEMYRQEFGLPRNPVKALVGISGECNCGSFAKPGELEAIRAVEPGRAEYLERLTDRAKDVGFPWGWGEPVPDWWAQMMEDRRRGQLWMFNPYEDDGHFMPMCVGCPMGRR